MKTYFKAAKLMTEKADAEENLEDIMEVSNQLCHEVTEGYCLSVIIEFLDIRHLWQENASTYYEVSVV